MRRVRLGPHALLYPDFVTNWMSYLVQRAIQIALHLAVRF